MCCRDSYVVKEESWTQKVLAKSSYRIFHLYHIRNIRSILKEMEVIGCKDYVAYNNYKMNHPTNYDICLGRISKVKDNYSRAEMQIAWSEIERLKKQNKELFDKLGRSAKY